MASPASRLFPGNLPFSYYLLGALCVLIVCIIFSIVFVNYQGSVENQKRQQQMTIEQTESDIVRTITLIDGSRKIHEKTFYPPMVSVMDSVIELYEESGGSISPSDLGDILNSTNMKGDILFINKGGFIEISTRTELEGENASLLLPGPTGLNAPDLWTNSFTPHRAFLDTHTGTILLPSSMATPDQRFLVILTLTDPDLKEGREILDYSRGMGDIIASHPAIKNLRIFSSDRELLSGTKSLVPDDLAQAALDRVVNSGSTLDLSVNEGKWIVRYLYISLEDPAYHADMDMIVELTYDLTRSEGHFQSLLVSNILAGIGLFVISMLVLIPLIHALTHPLRQITDDVNTIARGDLEHRIRKTQGKEFTVLEESITSMVGTLKTTIRNLQMSEDLYREVVESQNELICRRTPDGTCIFANEAFCRYYKKTTNEIIGTRFFPQIPADEASIRDRTVASLSREDPSSHIRHRVVLPDGRVGWHSCQIKAFFDSDGNITEIQEVCRDISERMEFEIALKESEERFRNLIEKSPISIAILRAEMIVYANPALITLLGYQDSTALFGQSILKFMHEGQRNILAQRNSMRDRSVPVPNDYETIGTRIDGSMFHCHVLISDIDLSDGPATIAYITDITRRKQAEEELNTLYSEMEQRVTVRTAELSRANKELESFSYSVSHDLKAPLRAIDGYSSILSQKYAPQLSDEARIYLAKIRQNTLHMADLINDVLELSRVGRVAIKKENINIEKIVRDVIDEFSSEINDRQIRVQIAPLPPCHADPMLAHLVFSNLISNAIKFSRDRTRTLIEIGTHQGDRETVYTIKDNGIGFDMKYANNLFKVFTRLNNAGDFEGTGIGLAIVSRIIERHGGRIWVEAEPDRGATFFFTFGTDPGP